MQKLKLTLIALSIFIIAGSCTNPKQAKEAETTSAKENTNENDIPEALNDLTKAHNNRAFNKKEVITFDMALFFRGNLRLDATITATTNSTKVLVSKKNGEHLLYENGEVYISPDTANTEGARFDALTWSYFALAPFKFKDTGTHWKENAALPLDSTAQQQPTLKLTFGNEVGDAPDDWYIIYQYPESNLLKAMAYIVTFGNKTQETAEQNPHAIVYDDYQTIDDIKIASKWSFHDWNSTDGLGKQLGSATISNIKFTNYADDLFALADKKLVPLNSK